MQQNAPAGLRWLAACENDFAMRPTTLDHRMGLSQIGGIDGSEFVRERRAKYTGVDQLGNSIHRKERLIHRVVKGSRELLSGRGFQISLQCELGESPVPTRPESSPLSTESRSGDTSLQVAVEEHTPSLGGWFSATLLVPGNGGLRQFNSELQDLAMDARCSPQRIPRDHLRDLEIRSTLQLLSVHTFLALT